MNNNEPTIPALNEDGWVTDPIKINDYLLSHFFASDYSQDTIFYGSVSSFAQIVQRNTGNINALCGDLKNSLGEYYSRYFNNVQVNVYDPATDQSSSNVSLSISIKFQSIGGEDFDISKLLQLDQNFYFKKIINAMNG